MVLATLFANIANAIRSKDGTTAAITASDFPARILAIRTGVETGDATATASDILSGKTAYAKGAKLTGNIATKTASNLTANGATVTVPAGYYASQATKSVATVTQATPTVTIDAAGKITASATQTAGYVAAGTKSGTKQLPTQTAQTITPGTEDITIPGGKYLTGAQTVQGDPNLIEENIKAGVEIFGVEGAFQSEIFTVKYLTDGYGLVILPIDEAHYLVRIRSVVCDPSTKTATISISARSGSPTADETVYTFTLGEERGDAPPEEGEE